MKVPVINLLPLLQLHQENRKKGKKREKSVDEEDEEIKREKLIKVCYYHLCSTVKGECFSCMFLFQMRQLSKTTVIIELMIMFHLE